MHESFKYAPDMHVCSGYASGMPQVYASGMLRVSSGICSAAPGILRVSSGYESFGYAPGMLQKSLDASGPTPKVSLVSIKL